ncbi:MAG: BON domain-containing protein [Candidatus Angelobacter sp.]
MKLLFCAGIFVLAIAAAGSAQAQNPAGSGSGASPGTSAGMVNGQTAPTPQAGTRAGESPETPPAEFPVPATDAELQAQMQNALSREPTLSGDTVRASVDASTIQLSGSVGSAREKLIAARIARSYAGNKKLVNRLTITGRSSNLPQADHTAENLRSQARNTAKAPATGGSRLPSR